MVSVRAIYHNGQLQPLDPLDLKEGQEVQLHIVEALSPLSVLIEDMLVSFDFVDDELDENALVKELDQQLRGKRPLSEIILEDR